MLSRFIMRLGIFGKELFYFDFALSHFSLHGPPLKNMKLDDKNQHFCG